MKLENYLEGEKIYLRDISQDDCNLTYVDWLNDSAVNQYLETKWMEQNLQSIKEFVQSMSASDNNLLMAIIDKTTDKHIGNIKLGPINPHYDNADISYFIGEKEYWGRGVASEAIELVKNYAFDKLKLHQVQAGAYEVAIGSWKALEKNGFVREGIYKEQVLFEEKYIDVYRYAILNPNEKEKS